MPLRRIVVLIVLFLLGAFWLLAARSGAVGQPRFIGLTNGTVGVISSTYAGFSSNHSSIVQRWIARGTNAAVVRLTNDGSSGVWLFPSASIECAAAKRDALL